MGARETLEKCLNVLPDERLHEVLEFVEFLIWPEEREEWQQLGKAQFARAYGANEPEYTGADLKPGVHP